MRGAPRSLASLPRATPSRGFTLIEVSIAMGILAAGLAVLLHSQTLSLRAVSQARMMTTATMLARARIVELEGELEKDGFGAFAEEEQTGDFSDDDLPKFRWHTKVEKVELPGAIDAQSAAGAAQGLAGATGTAAAGADAMGGAAAAMIGQLDIIRDVLQEAIRKVTVTVLWSEGRVERSLAVQAYFTDPSAIDAAVGLAGAAAGALGGAGGAVRP